MAIIGGDYQVRVTLRTDTNLPKDFIVNTWATHFGDVLGEADDIPPLFVAFYQALGSYFSNTLSDAVNVHTVELIHLDDPEPRLPFLTVPFTLNGSGTPLPSEVAVCSSFRAFVGSGTNAARRRGRVYLGPLNNTTVASGGGYARPTPAFRSDIADAMIDLTAGLDAIGFPLCVWSRADDTLFEVEAGWINDEFDTQRRRGPEPTTRTVWNRAV